MNRSSNNHERRSAHQEPVRDETAALVRKCRELEAAVALWMAANQAKAERIEQLEDLCRHLQQRVARLGRTAGRRQRSTRPVEVRHAR